MTVYVDHAAILATVGRITSRWSHLTADAEEELHAFAEGLGLRRAYFQTCKSQICRPPCVHWHYDVTTNKREEALRKGAVPMDLRQWSELIRARRAALKAGER